MLSFLWRHNGWGSDLNHQPHDCLLNRLFRRRSKKTLKLRVTVFCAGNSSGTGEFPAQMASNAENVSMSLHNTELRTVLMLADMKNEIFPLASTIILSKFLSLSYRRSVDCDLLKSLGDAKTSHIKVNWSFFTAFHNHCKLYHTLLQILVWTLMPKEILLKYWIRCCFGH